MLIPLLTNPRFPYPELAAEVLTWSRDPATGPFDSLARQDEARRLRDLLEQLPAAQREVIRQRVYEGKKFREIAETLGCPLNTALARMHEGLKRLRLLWGESHV